MTEEYTGERFLPDACDMEMQIEHYQRYQFAKKYAKGKTVLDASCGEGYGSDNLAEVASRVIGLDIDKDTIDNAKQRYVKKNLSFVIGDVAELPFSDGCFDLVVSFETIEHVNCEVQTKFLKEIKRVLKQDGALIMSTPNKAVYTDKVEGENRFHCKEFYTQEFSSFMKEYFQHVDLFCQYPETGYFLTHEGSSFPLEHKLKSAQDSRYIIAVCSNGKPVSREDTSHLTVFNDEMYYFLYKQVHHLEKTVLSLKEESESFEHDQEIAISDQKSYIRHLESDIDSLKEEYQKQAVRQREEIAKQKDIISSRDKDIESLNQVIQEIPALKEIISQRDRDIEFLNGEIVKLKHVIGQREKNIADLDKEIKYRRTLKGRLSK